LPETPLEVDSHFMKTTIEIVFCSNHQRSSNHVYNRLRERKWNMEDLKVLKKEKPNVTGAAFVLGLLLR
jgi:hypothetical protein